MLNGKKKSKIFFGKLRRKAGMSQTRCRWATEKVTRGSTFLSFILSLDK
jgi:hypothetical protein